MQTNVLLFFLVYQLGTVASTAGVHTYIRSTSDPVIWGCERDCLLLLQEGPLAGLGEEFVGSYNTAVEQPSGLCKKMR